MAETQTIWELREIADNQKCMDCADRFPRYVCLDYNTFVCSACGNIHKELGHRVESASLYPFKENELDGLRKGGNKVAREQWLTRWTPTDFAEPLPTEPQKVREFMMLKYNDRKWAGGASYIPAPIVPPTMVTPSTSHKQDSNRSLAQPTISREMVAPSTFMPPPPTNLPPPPPLTNLPPPPPPIIDAALAQPIFTPPPPAVLPPPPVLSPVVSRPAIPSIPVASTRPAAVPQISPRKEATQISPRNQPSQISPRNNAPQVSPRASDVPQISPRKEYSKTTYTADSAQPTKATPSAPTHTYTSAALSSKVAPAPVKPKVTGIFAPFLAQQQQQSAPVASTPNNVSNDFSYASSGPTSTTAAYFEPPQAPSSAFAAQQQMTPAQFVAPTPAPAPTQYVAPAPAPVAATSHFQPPVNTASAPQGSLQYPTASATQYPAPVTSEAGVVTVFDPKQAEQFNQQYQHQLQELQQQQEAYRSHANNLMSYQAARDEEERARAAQYEAAINSLGGIGVSAPASSATSSLGHTSSGGSSYAQPAPAMQSAPLQPAPAPAQPMYQAAPATTSSGGYAAAMSAPSPYSAPAGYAPQAPMQAAPQYPANSYEYMAMQAVHPTQQQGYPQAYPAPYGNPNMQQQPQMAPNTTMPYQQQTSTPTPALAPSAGGLFETGNVLDFDQDQTNAYVRAQREREQLAHDQELARKLQEEEDRNAGVRRDYGGAPQTRARSSSSTSGGRSRTTSDPIAPITMPDEVRNRQTNLSARGYTAPTHQGPMAKCNGCQMDLPADQLGHHNLHECLFRPMFCHFCGRNVKYVQFNDHQQVCAGEKQPCNSCGQIFYGRDIPFHMRQAHGIVRTGGQV